MKTTYKFGINLRNDHMDMGAITIDSDMKVMPITATSISQGYFRDCARQEELFREKYNINPSYRFYRFPNPEIEDISALKEPISVEDKLLTRKVLFFPKEDLGWWADPYGMSWHLIYTEDKDGNGKVYPYNWIKDDIEVIE